MEGWVPHLRVVVTRISWPLFLAAFLVAHSSVALWRRLPHFALMNLKEGVMNAQPLSRECMAAITAAILIGTAAHDVCAAPSGYIFTPIAYLGNAAPGGGMFVNDFEPGGLNNRGDMAFGADASTGGEGVFLGGQTGIVQLGRTGDPAPGGGTFEFGFLGPVALNDEGDVAFNFLLKDFDPALPFGVNAGVYRYSHGTGGVTSVVVPFVTPAPDEGVFQGVGFNPSINNRGDIVFPGIIVTDKGVHPVPDTGEPYVGLGVGVYRAGKNGSISSVVVPGDAAPGGGMFDFAIEPWINDGGDISFAGHIAGEESVIAGFPPQAVLISALYSLYLRNASTGEIRTIVHSGDAAPGGGAFRQGFHNVLNNRGDIAFIGDLTPPPGANESVGVFLYSRGAITAVARPGDPMPGGGRLVNASLVGGNVHVNNRGDVVFSGIVDTDVDGDGFADTGLFVWSQGALRAIARTGTVIPGVGTIDELASPQLVIPPAPVATTTSGAINNDRGQVLFMATLTDGNAVLLLATPRP